MPANDKGDVKINGNWFRIDLPSYRVSDIVDFSPRASTPGGSILHSELGLYQPLLQTDWRHGFGHAWYADAQGYLSTDGHIDTRHQGAAMLFTNLTTQGSATNLAIQGGFFTFANAVYAWGSAGLWKFNGATWDQVTDTLTGTVSVTSGTNGITGAGTAFLSELAVGDVITVGGGAGSRTIASVSSDTAATVTSNWSSTVAGQVITIGITGNVRMAFATGSYIFFNYHSCRIKKATSAHNITNAGLNANAGDYDWGLIAGGRIYFGKRETSRVHHTNQEDASDLEGTTGDANVIYIGTGGYTTLNAVIYAGKLYILTVDGIWLLDTQSHIPSKVLDLASEVSTTNFRGAVVHNGFLVFPVRDRLYQWNGVRLADITPPQINDQFPYVTYGRFDNLTVVGRFLFLTARTSDSQGTTLYEDLLCYDGVGWFKLCRPVDAANETVSAMNYDVVNNRMWLQIDAATDRVLHIPFQNLSEYPYADFPTSGTHRLTTSRLDMGFRRVTKSVPSILIEGTNLTANRHIKVYYSLNGGSWTAWGGVDGTSNVVTASGVTELSDPLGTSGSTLEFKYIQFRLQLVTDSVTQTPVLESFTVRFLMRPDVAYGYSFQIIGATRSRYGQFTDGRSAKDIVDALRTARDSKAPIVFQDIWGATRQVYVSSVQERAVERHLKDPIGATNEPSVEQIIQLNLVEVG